MAELTELVQAINDLHGAAARITTGEGVTADQLTKMADRLTSLHTALTSEAEQRDAADASRAEAEAAEAAEVPVNAPNLPTSEDLNEVEGVEVVPTNNPAEAEQVAKGTKHK